MVARRPPPMMSAANPSKPTAPPRSCRGVAARGGSQGGAGGGGEVRAPGWGAGRPPHGHGSESSVHAPHGNSPVPPHRRHEASLESLAAARFFAASRRKNAEACVNTSRVQRQGVASVPHPPLGISPLPSQISHSGVVKVILSTMRAASARF
jgi:hypothetical protein